MEDKNSGRDPSEMICYICGRLCDERKSGLCVEHESAVRNNNYKVKMLTLLKMAAVHCPVQLREQIEGMLEDKALAYWNRCNNKEMI